MTDIFVEKQDETYSKITTDDQGIDTEIWEFFTFTAPNYQFQPSYKKGRWDGTLKLFDLRNKKLYNGLLRVLVTFAQERDYTIEFSGFSSENEITPEEVSNFIDGLNLMNEKGEHLTMRFYQMQAIYEAIRFQRRIILSPTGSGKSLISYALTRIYSALSKKNKDGKVLIVVPTRGLVTQLYNDFKDYSQNNGWDVEKECHLIYSGQEKANPNASVYISTWQSIYDLDKNYFKNFNAVIVDEVHLAEANCIKGILEKCTSADIRVGLTGTLRDAKTHKLVLEGLFGKIKRVENTRDMIDRGELAEQDIHFLYLEYPNEDRKQLARELTGYQKATAKYKAEVDFLCEHQKRNIFVKNLSLNLNGNTLVLYNFVENHGMVLRDLIERDANTDRHVFFVYGGTSADQREKIRHIVETQTDAIIIASFGTFSTGINIKNIHNIVFASPSKSKIRVLQSIGRGLRKSETKDTMSLYDIVDDLSTSNFNNYALQHGASRREIYDEEKFFYKVHNIEL